MPPLQSVVLTKEEEFESLRSCWQELHERVGGTVFQSHTWLSNWWSVYGESFRLRILALRDGDRLVALFPCFIEEKSMKLFTLRRLRFLGEHDVYGEYVPLVDPAYEQALISVAADFCSGLLKDSVCDCLDFHHFSPSCTFLQKLIDELKDRSLAVYYDSHSLSRVEFDLPADWEGYLKLLSYDQRGSRGRHERSLCRKGAEFEVVSGCRNDSVFDEFVALHTGVWTMKGKGGFFITKERFGRFLKSVAGDLGEENVARWYFYKKDGKRFAGILGFFSHNRACLYLSGRDPSHELAKLSPGTVLMSLAIKDAIELGCTTCDLQEGDTPYKFSLGGKDTGYAHAIIYRKNANGLKALSFVLLLLAGNSKLWKKKIEPKLDVVLFRLRGKKRG